MTESTTRDFISQWPYDHAQGYDESTMQWRGVDRVAEQIRQREERHLDEDFATMDFETRAATLEAHFFQPLRRSSGRKSPVGARPVTRIRPQSASHTRRATENNRPANSRVRPQSAKTRSEVPCSVNVVQNQNRVVWKSVAQQNPSKWREMLERGPEFEQLNLRRLELETYELLYNTLQQHQVVESKATTRRRKRQNSAAIAGKAQDCSPTLACGSGLHLARSRKRRQQEHDRQMMLGKGRESSRADRSEDNQAIQDKTRTRSKLVNKKKAEKQRLESQHTSQTSAQQRAPKFPHQTRSTRGPWIPSGLSRSLGKSFETCEKQVSMEKRVAEVLAAFRRQADTHLRSSRNVQNQLKAQQSARERRPRKTDLPLDNSTVAKPHVASTRSKSANATMSRQTSSRSSSSDKQLQRNCSNQDTEEPAAVEVQSPRSAQCALQSPGYGNENLPSESLATLTLVIPPLKLPPHLWEDQQTHDSVDSASSDLPVQNKMVGTSSEPTVQYLELGVACEDYPESFVQSGASAHATAVAESKTSNMAPANCDLMSVTSAELHVANDLDADVNEASCTNQDSDVSPIGSTNEEISHEEQKEESTGRQDSDIVEEEHVAESLIERASTGSSPEDTEPSPTAFGYELSEEEFSIVSCGTNCDSRNNLPDVEKDDYMNLLSDRDMFHGETGACGEEGAQVNEERILVEGSMSPRQETSTGLSVHADVNVTVSQPAETEAFALKESVLDLNDSDVGTSVESDTKGGEQLLTVRYVVNKSPSSRIEVAGLGGKTNSADVDKFDILVEISPQAATDSDVLPYVGDSERGLSGNTIIEPANMVDEADSSLSFMRSEQSVCGYETLTYQEMVLRDEKEGIKTASISSDYLVESKGNESAYEGSNSSAMTMSGSQYDQSTDGPLDPSLLTDSKTLLLDRSISMESGETLLLLTTDAGAIDQARMIPQLATSEATDRLDRNDCVRDLQSPETNRNHSESDTGDEQRDVEYFIYNNTVSSNLLSLAMETLTDTATTTSTMLADHKIIEMELTTEHATVHSTSPSAKSEPRSPKKTKISKSNATQKEPTMTVTNGETAIATPPPPQDSSPQSQHGTGDLQKEDPFWLHQQAVTRSFLQRVSSRKLAEENLDSIHSQSCQEQVERDNQLRSTVRVSVAAVVDAETLLGQNENPVKERESIDGDAVSPLKRECSEALNDCYSTVEKYPQVLVTEAATLDLATTSPTENDTRVDDGSTSTSVMTDTCPDAKPAQVNSVDRAQWKEEPDASQLSGGEQEASTQERPQLSLTFNTLAPLTEKFDQDPTQPWTEHHNAARKIQSLYRCFVRRQLILDQLRFMVAKKRRQTRRKTRQKIKKTRAADAVGSGLEHESSVAGIRVDADNVENLLDEVQHVAPASVSCAIGLNLTPELHSSEIPEPIERIGPPKGSSEFAVELFDDFAEVNGDMLGATTDLENPASENYVVNSPNYTTSFELPLVEEVVSHHQPTLLPSENTEVGPSNNKLAAASVDTAIDSESAAMQPRWDRYVDSTTSKSFYYNPVTNETQWTAPGHTAINSADAAAATATDAVVSPSGQDAPTRGTWQEFLDEASGQLYYYNTKTGECSWEPPSGDSPEVVESLQSVATAESAAIGVSSWVMYVDPASQAPYYVNVETLATSWEAPDSFTVAAAAAEPNVTATANEDSYVIDDHVALEI
ncbi:hypothetical protein L914_06234 [Phytophthora nicotianae]|uniref:WW domain-containing protein n=1 Tax=Phytophthora nicotianae TaxID=4792 RepID=W2NLK2_PHYNI|nr:hypothetical protein L914_06234 [Phytophthora nicotianae]